MVAKLRHALITNSSPKAKRKKIPVCALYWPASYTEWLERNDADRDVTCLRCLSRFE